MNDLNMGVLCGGPSSEKEISRLSGKAVHEALIHQGYRVSLMEYEKNTIQRIHEGHINFVFIAMHGRFGEDGQIQSLLEREGIAYSGSGPEACRLAMDKVLARERFHLAGLQIAPGEVIRNKGEADNLSRLTPVSPAGGGRQAWLTPAFVKPARGGSSICVTRVDDPERLQGAIMNAFDEDDTVLIEKAVEGREFSVGVLGEELLGPIEIKTRRSFFDYEAKYADDSTEFLTRPSIPDERKSQLLQSAFVAHNALGLEVFSRVDMIMTDENITVIEANAIPGLTPMSLLPKMAQDRGIHYEALLNKIIELSLQTNTRIGT